MGVGHTLKLYMEVTIGKALSGDFYTGDRFGVILYTRNMFGVILYMVDRSCLDIWSPNRKGKILFYSQRNTVNFLVLVSACSIFSNHLCFLSCLNHQSLSELYCFKCDVQDICIIFIWL